jgi:hypothetical protein
MEAEPQARDGITPFTSRAGLDGPPAYHASA